VCAPRKPAHPAEGWRVGLRNALTNWNQPLPFPVKVAKAVRNLWTRFALGSTCCGHDGEPGC
jgi:hypothetical protein